MRRSAHTSALGLLAWLVAAIAIPAAAAEPIPIRAVIVTMFEQGADTGDTPGEFQTWVERLPLPEVLPFPAGYHHLRINRRLRVLGVVTGIGTAKAASSIMALGLDPRFDLRRAYWIVAGIAGVDPRDMSVGSAAWAEYVVDGDLAHEIDAREIPDDWTTGFVPLNTSEPYPRPVADSDGSLYRLEPRFVDWAFNLTRDIRLQDTIELRQLRAKYVDFPQAQRAPFVLKGDTLSASTFWHGQLLNQWANRWVRYWTRGRGNFATSAMEDTGTAQALSLLDRADRADFDRLLVLRTGSNYTMQYPGITAAESLAEEQHGQYSAYLPSLAAAYRVGHRVLTEILGDWDVYAERIPAVSD